jgi:O-antigen ligase
MALAATRPGLGAALAGLAAAAVVGAAIGASVGGGLRLGEPLALSLAAALVAALAAAAAASTRGGVRRVLLVAIVLDTSLQVDVSLFYRDAAAALGALGGLNLSLTTVALAILYGLWLLQALGEPREAPRPALAGTGAVAVYLGLTALATLTAPDPALAGFELLIVVQSVLLFVYLVSTLRARSDVVLVVAALLVSVALQGAVSVATAVGQQTVSVLGVSNRVAEPFQTGSAWRAGGTLGSPNSAGGFFALALSPVLAIALSQGGGVLARLAPSVLLLGAAGLVVTQSRGGWVAFGIASLLIVTGLVLRRLARPRSVQLLVVAVVAVAPLLLPTIATRLTSPDAGAVAARGPLNVIGLRMIGDHPFLGVGPNSFGTTLRDYATPEFSRTWLYTVHNTYLLVASERGVPALLALLLVLVGALAHGVRAARTGDGLVAALAIGFGAGLVGHMVHMQFELFNARPAVQLLWIVLALLVVLSRGLPVRTDERLHGGRRT